jgi:hypothetical protein
MVVEKFRFYLLRFRNAPLPELLYRAKQFFLVKKSKIQLSPKKYPTAVPKIDTIIIKDLKLPAIRGDASAARVQKILKGKLFTHNTDVSAISRFEDTWRNTYFDDIKISDKDPDIRSVWEPARLQHVAILINHIIQNDNIESSDRLKDFTKNAIIKWLNENPFLFGPHYISAMECGLRIPLLFYCLKVLDNLGADDFQLILDSIYRHAWWVSNRLSLYSSIGNHTIAEATGLIFGGAVYRSTAEGSRWLAEGHELLKRELEHQIVKDGGPAEQSLNYHRFVLDLYWLAIDFLRKNNLHDCSSFGKRLTRAEQFMAAFESGCGSLPSIGDSDDGHAIAPGVYPRRPHPDNKKLKIQTFSKSGYTIYNDKNVVLTFDHGPLGMAPLYNHGHADALSITLSVGGREILVDPGTYRYNGEPQFRRYFKSTRAHNTVTIDGQDQAIQQTGFIWSHPYNVKVLRNENLNGVWLIQAEHDGYLRYKKPVKHMRSVLIFEGKKIIMQDKFSGEGTHEFELNFHLHPDATLSKCQGNLWYVYNGAAEIYITIFDQNNIREVKGERDPLLGWFSRSYGQKCETSVLSILTTGISEESKFTTGIGVDTPIDLQEFSEKLDEIERAVEHT